MTLRVGWDLDGVVYPFADACITWFHTQHGIPREQMPMPDRWNTWECWGMERDDWIAGVNEGVKAGFIFAVGTPERDAVMVNNQLRARGHTQHIITARSGEGHQVNTHHWLRVTGFGFDTLDFSHDKTTRPVDVMIEDKLENYDTLTAAGVQMALIDRPWNQDDGQRRRVYTLQQYLGFVDEVAADRDLQPAGVA